jgi:hypothetical protein
MNFNEITKIALKKKPKDAKCSEYRTYSTESSVGTKRSKIEDVLGEDRFGFRRVKENRDTMGKLRIK